MTWDVVLLEEVEAWVLDLEPDSYDQVVAAIDKLADDGPTLGRPLVDRIQGSRVHNLKELRPGSAGTTEFCILFVFDLPTTGRLAGGRRQGGTLDVLVRRGHPVGRGTVRTLGG